MILRRVIKHFRHQEWAAIFLDFLIVVVGVFVGLQVNNWNAARGERAEEVYYLKALAGDAKASIAEVTEQVTFLEKQAAAQRRLVRFSDGAEQDLTTPELDALVQVGLYELYTVSPRQVTFEELKSSGKLPLLKSSALRTKLQEVDAQIAKVKQWESDIAQMFYLFSDPFLIDNYDVRGFAAMTPNKGEGNITDWLPPLKNRQDTRTVLQNRRFQNIVLYRGNTGSGLLGLTKALRDSYVDIDALIADRLDELGTKP
ncbi:MAG: hypothetical protein COA84_16105 [Robiginitomaculum sp.]|nr:MAG: hypothetical protein COA84_16105 [Robiginitomaculum sp.]